MTALDFRPPTSTADDLKRKMRAGVGWEGQLHRHFVTVWNFDITLLDGVDLMFREYEAALVDGKTVGKATKIAEKIFHPLTARYAFECVPDSVSKRGKERRR